MKTFDFQKYDHQSCGLDVLSTDFVNYIIRKLIIDESGERLTSIAIGGSHKRD